MTVADFSWDSSTIAPLLLREVDGFVDMWNLAPPGHKATPRALKDLRESNGKAVMQGLALVEQQAMVVTGYIAGLRPEIFAALRDLPGVDVIETAATAILDSDGKFDFGSLSKKSEKIASDILAKIGERFGAPLALAEYVEGAGQVVAFVYQWAAVIVDGVNAERARTSAVLEKMLECVPPGYSAAQDRNEVQDALNGVMMTGDWTRLFVPEVRPVDPDFVHPFESIGRTNLADPDFWAGASAVRGFTCCISTFDRGRVIAPLGGGVGNRGQTVYDPAPIFYGGDDFGFGLLPMCPDVPVHRAQIVPGGHNEDQYDGGEGLPVLAGLGAHAWHLLWAANPVAFSVDGDFIAGAWAEYLALMIDFIARNRGPTHSVDAGDWGPDHSVSGVCDDWPAAGRYAALSRFFKRLGATTESPEWDGIGVPQRTAPVVQWRRYAEYQATLLERPMINYVDARTCAPTWRARVEAAQRDYLQRPAEDVCRLVTNAIPDPALRAEVAAYKKSTRACWVGGWNVLAGSKAGPREGASLETHGGPPPPPIPSMPKPQLSLNPSRQIEDDESGGALFVALLGLAGVGGFGWWLARRNSKGRRR